jgi:UDP-glucose 4-epimerase
MTETILVTGGAGYIGSHACVELAQAGYNVVIVDSLLNSNAGVISRIEAIAGKKFPLHRVDLLDQAAVAGLFAKNRFDAVIHFAGLKAVGESTQQPLRYFHNNLTGTLNLLQAMSAAKVRRLVFSSSATVYGDPKSVPVNEGAPLSATNPYGRTKLMIEDMLRDLCKAERDWRMISLRYFNPAGAHASGTIGEDPVGIPNNLMPYLMQVAIGKRPRLDVFGGDYPTADGTGVRDYIHVVDLAQGHIAALRAIGALPGFTALNLGTGRGYSVLEMVRAVSKACGRDIPYQIVARRPGDVAACYADVSAANRVLGWKAERGLDAMCADGWRWQSRNPNGYMQEGPPRPTANDKGL